MLRQALRLACAVSLLGSVTVTPSAAQPADKRTLFTFSAPVAMPGVTLPAGQYLFRLANPESGRNVIQVLSADSTRPYGLFFAMRAERPEIASSPEVRFMETARDMPAAIKTWWYPGERSGYEFIYPKEQARRLAQGGSQPVLTTRMETTTSEQTNTGDLARVSSTGQETQVAGDAPQTIDTRTGANQQGTIAAAGLSIPNAAIPALIEAPRAEGVPAATVARSQLPQTAGTGPMLAAVGVAALLGGLGLWGWRRARA